ncbi:S8 family serine peptidase [Patescibacteria group bacterium]|nr:S8 family serine peptidase [Patescibacteria group bacterium]
MKKIGLGILIAGFVIVIAGAAIAQGPVNRQSVEVVLSDQEVGVPQQAIDSSPVLARVIAPTTSSWSKLGYRLMGCTVIHELQDGIALKCPSQIASLLNLREDRIFHIMDLEADIQINADDVWAQGIDGTGVNVAVLDTGINTDHPELSDSIVGCETFVDGTVTCEDDHGHGTHVSGIITANGVDGMARGVAPEAGIYMYKVCSASGSCYESDMMAAMEAAVLTGVKVMSISIGGGNFAGENCDSDPLAAKVNWVVSRGITVVVASGNDQYYVSSPACASGAIAVGAVDKNGLMASFSNFGPALDIVAPGVNIYSSIIDGYASWSGTSMSAPHVAGTVALVLDANASLTVDKIKTALYGTADPINSDSVCYGVTRQKGAAIWIGVVECTSDNYGAGIVDVFGAVNYYVPQEPECTVGGDCDDGLYCNGIETCVFGFCQSETLVDCSYLSDQCNDGVCNEITGGYQCVAQLKTDGTLCDNELFCTENDYCSAGICLSGTSKNCDDSEGCTTDSCDEYLGACENTWPVCSLANDGCCGPECDSTTDVNCPAEDPCLSCFKGVCDGKCNPVKEDATCQDCQN